MFKDENAVKVRENAITTIIGPETEITGGIKSKGSIRIGGSVRGNVESEGVVVITKDAYVKGNIIAQSAVIAGKVRGDLKLSDKVNIEASGEVYGDIETRRLLIDDESVFSGKCTMNREEDSRKAAADLKKAREDIKRANERAKAKTEPGDSKEDNDISYIDITKVRQTRKKKR